MQVIGIDISDGRNFRCGRIQNTDKPEFVKCKQFAQDQKGIKSLASWVAECSAGDTKDVAVAICVESQQGAALAYHFYDKGYAVIPLSNRSVVKYIEQLNDKRTIAECIAQRAVVSKDRWKPMNEVCIEARAALLEREDACLETKRNIAKSESYQDDAAYDFLFRLTQNAASSHVERRQEAEKRLRSVAKKDDFKDDVKRLMTIPGMDDLTAISLVYFMHAYAVDSSEAFGSLLCLHHDTRIRRLNYRWADLKAVRDMIYQTARRLRNSLPQAKALADRLSAAGKSDRVINMAVAHKLAILAFAMVKTQRDYQA